MRYLIAVVSGALLASLPPYMLTFPDYAWKHACLSATESLPATSTLGEQVEDPCWLIHETMQPLSIRLLMLGMLVVGCIVGGVLASRITDRRQVFAGFTAPFLAYMALFVLGDPTVSFIPIAVAMALVAGTIGAVGAGCQSLTNAWSATRAKPRAPQA